MQSSSSTMAISRDQIKRAIHAGIGTAVRNYLEWSAGLTLEESGVEGLLVAEIARKLHGDLSNPEFLRLEVPITNVQELSDAPPPRGRTLGTFQGNKRADVVLFNGRGRPTCMIEVKRWIYKNSDIIDDLTRLSDVLRKCARQNSGTLQRGFLAIYDGRQNDTVRNWIDGFFSKTEHVTLHDYSERKVRWGKNWEVSPAPRSIVVEVTPVSQ